MDGRPKGRRGRMARVIGTSLKVALPVMPHQRTVVAATCPLCGRLLVPDHFYSAGEKVNFSKCRRCVSWKKVKLPPAPLGRTLVAKSCRTCETLLLSDQFYARETECKGCNIERARRWQDTHPAAARESAKKAGRSRRARRLADDPEGFREEARLASKRLQGRWQVETERTAHRHGYEWTGPELEVAARPDLTTREVAEMLGRTLFAVQTRRHLLRTDPKTQNHAGLSRASSPARSG